MFVLIIFACNPATGPRCQESKENTADDRYRKREGNSFCVLPQEVLLKVSEMSRGGPFETVANPSSFFPNNRQGDL